MHCGRHPFRPSWRRQAPYSEGAEPGTAKQAVAEQMQGRFQTFADNFIRGMRRLPQGLEVYRHLLQAATDASDQELMAGIDSNVMLQRIWAQAGGNGIRLSDLTQALDASTGCK